eukprot:TRINITY_DN81035_c0_g1_i1.p1 TRINITY_DN81035_c0_g1~~TRINITY_DN81035_c0_g1_i1.p1  ORF type:complete len:193 (+),score=34.03 TRINITY_DN81035_c0_g1_i1:55-579(+)
MAVLHCHTCPASETSAGSETRADDALAFLLNAKGSTTALFLGILAASKTAAWAGLVLVTARWRNCYAARLWASGPLGVALAAWRSRCPGLAARLDAAAARAAESRSALLLARSVGAAPRDLAPAVAEATVAFRFIWPVWFPVQCMLMMRCWPAADAPSRSARRVTTVEDVPDDE